MLLRNSRGCLPVRDEKVVPGIGAMDHDDIAKGYRLSEGNYVLFVENDAIDILCNSKPYYVVPADELAEEAYVVLSEALK